MNDQKYLIEGIQAGSAANNAIADIVARKAAAMLQQTLDENLKTLLEAKLTQVVNETLSLHADKTKEFAQKFLAMSKTKLATNVIETQHNNQTAKIRNLKFEDLAAFDDNISDEVARLADESGTMTMIQADTTSPIGF